jgi:ribosomal protein S12
MPSVIEDITTAFRNRKFAQVSLEEGTLVISFQSDPEAVSQENPIITVENVDEEDISYNIPI